MFSEKRALQDNKIMKELGVNEIHHIVARTNKGELSIMLRKDEDSTQYRFVLDSVPVEDEKNDTLKMLYNLMN